MSIGKHTSGADERLAATDFHVARRKQVKLENGDADQLQLLKNSDVDVLDAGGVARMGNHRESRDIPLQSGVSRVQHHKIGGSRSLHKSLVKIAVPVVEYPCVPVWGVRWRGNHRPISVQIIDNRIFTARQKILCDMAYHLFRGCFSRSG